MKSLLINPDLKLENILQILGLIATFITIILVFKTLKEMQLQRKNSYKPEMIIVSKGSFTANIPKVNDSDFFPFFPFIDWKNKQSDNDFHIEFFNVGLGVAKNIKIKWQYDFYNLTKTLNYLYKTNSLPIDLELKNETLKYAVPTKKILGVSSTVENIYYDYILPASISDSPIVIRVPHLLQFFYTNLLPFRIKTEYSEYIKTSLALSEETKSIITIEYCDLDNLKHKKQFSCKIKPNHLSTKPSSKENIIILKILDGNLEFKEL